MFSAEQQAKKIEVSVAETYIAVQVIDRAFAKGIITGQEAAIVGRVRNSFVANLAHNTGVNYDQPQQAAAAPAAEAKAEETTAA